MFLDFSEAGSGCGGIQQINLMKWSLYCLLNPKCSYIIGNIFIEVCFSVWILKHQKTQNNFTVITKTQQLEAISVQLDGKWNLYTKPTTQHAWIHKTYSDICWETVYHRLKRACKTYNKLIVRKSNKYSHIKTRINHWKSKMKHWNSKSKHKHWFELKYSVNEDRLQYTVGKQDKTF